MTALRPVILALLGLTMALGLAAADDDPAVYITAADTACFSPASALSGAAAAGLWFQRKVGFAARGDTILTAQAGGLYPDLTVKPNLRGRYHLFINLREVNAVTGLQVKLSGRELAYTVSPALGTATVHTNRDILVATDVDMTGQTVLLRHIGRLVYFSYLKFVPVAAGPADLKVDPERVREEPPISPATEWVKTRDLVHEGMVEVKHQPGVPATPAAMGPGGYVLFARPTLDLIFPDTVPGAEDVVSELRVSAARGEDEPVTFAVRAAADLGACRVSVDDLVSGTKRIPKGSIRVASVACRNLRVSFSGKTFMHAPVMLDATSPVSLAAQQTKQFWLTVQVPASATPGDYAGAVTFIPARGTPTRLKLTLHVYPFVLAEPKNVSLGMYDQLWALRGGADWLRDHCADMRAHGMTSVGYCGGLNGQIVLKNGVAGVQFDGSCGFEQFMEAYRDAGFSQPVLWLMSGDIWQWCGSQAKPGSAEFAALHKQVIQSILRQSQARRWPGIVFQPIDEPGSYEQRPNAGYLAQWAAESELIKAAGGTVEVDHIPFSTDDERLKGALARALPVTDIFTERFSTKPIWFEKDGWWWGSLKEQAEQWGKRLWSYNINDAAFFPELPTMRLAYGYFLWLQGVSGQFTWSYQGVSGSPLNALDGAYTDMMYTYPAIPEAGAPGGPSLMWECIREGVDDLRYVQMLGGLIARAEARGQGQQAAAARAVLERMRASFDWERVRSRNRYIECQWERTATAPNGQRSVGGRFNVPNGWGLEDYDRWRTAVAREIVRLGAL
ncbi:hypothetical protein LLH23_17805 [bacterium]|nr:hypothetical protein [bacterium]